MTLHCISYPGAYRGGGALGTPCPPGSIKGRQEKKRKKEELKGKKRERRKEKEQREKVRGQKREKRER